MTRISLACIVSILALQVGHAGRCRDRTPIDALTATLGGGTKVGGVRTVLLRRDDLDVAGGGEVDRAAVGLEAHTLRASAVLGGPRRIDATIPVPDHLPDRTLLN